VADAPSIDAPFTIVEALYPGLTQLDFTGPHTIFSRIPGAEVIVASEAGGPIESDDRLTFAGTKRMANIVRCDLLFVPGGLAAFDVINNLGFMAEFKRLAEGARYLTSVCTGSLVLGAAGLLKGKHAACHWAWRDMLPLFGAVPDPGRIVRDGNVITGGGVTAGIDFALVVAAELAGEAFAQSVQLNIEYAPAPPFDSGRPESATPEALAMSRARYARLLPGRLEGTRAAAGRLSLT
jgi:putative intracellular protease/amidase